MRDAAIVFVVQFAYVLMLGLQSLAVNGGRYGQAALQSTLLGMMGITITNEIVRRGEAGGVVWWAYVVSGPAGIVTSMWLFKRIGKR